MRTVPPGEERGYFLRGWNLREEREAQKNIQATWFFQRTSDLILDTLKFLISSYLKVSLNSCFRNSIFTPKPVFKITIAILIKIIDHQSVGSEERREEREMR